MERKVHESNPEVYPRSLTRSVLLGAWWAIVILLFLAGCDSTYTYEYDGFDCWAGFHTNGTTGFCNLDFLDDDFVAEADFSEEVAVGQQTRIRLDAINGPVEIHGDPNATSVRVSGKRRVGSKSLQDAERHLDDLEVRVEDLTDEVFIKTVQPQRSLGRKYIVEYTITVPEHLDVDIHQTNGDIKVRDAGGNVRVDLVNGVLDVFSALPSSGAVDLKLVNGSIKLGISKSTSAALSASAANGQINTSNLALKDLVRRPRFVTGRLGDGEAKIDLAITNGTITVTGH